MSDQSKLEQMSDTQGEHPSRRQERLQRRAKRQAGGLGWMAGLVLIIT